MKKYGKIMLYRYIIKELSKFIETRKVNAHKKGLEDMRRSFRLRVMVLEEK
jgi:hypothetical protein